MKKYLALFLACAMLLPLLSGCAVFAAGSEEVGIEPFYGVGGTEIYDSDMFPNVRNYCRINFTLSNGELVLSRPGCGRDIKKIAADMKKDMDSRPEGMRILQIFGTRNAFGLAPEEVIYLDKGVDELKALLEELMKEFYEIGGTLTGVALDLEYIGLSSYYLSQKVEKDPTLLGRIVKHPNYATEVRPLLEAFDFDFFPGNTDYAPEIFGVYDGSGAEYAQARRVWDRVMSIRLGQYQIESCVEPVWKYFPDALINDYQYIDAYAWSKMPSSEGAKSYLAGHQFKVGNVSNYSSYHSRPSKNLFYETSKTKEYRVPEAFNGSIYRDTPFNMLKWDNNLFKTMYFDSDTHLVSACICAYDYSSGRKGGIANTPYYTENLFHIGLLDPRPFRLYVYHKEYDTIEDYHYRLSIISEVLGELTRVVGAADRKPIVLPKNWNDSFVLSGMYAGGKNVWRITPDMSTGVTRESFLVEGEDPTFRINGQTVTFPGGKILEEGNISVVGSCGYWIETETNVVPIIENDADRYAKNPAFLESFEDYEEGSILTVSEALPAYSWEITAVNREASVVVADNNNPGNQLLAITGGASYKNTLLPKNVTAGDSFAKQQAWEITVTLPETMGADAVITLLETDKIGGIKITADKVFYDEKGEYVELAKMKLNPGSTYTVKRELFMVSEEVAEGEEAFFTSNYYIYDAEGKLIGSKEGVAIKSFKLPVAKAGFSCENLGNSTAYFDDFKMYAIGFNADFFLYKVDNGLELSDKETARAGETAYRYSWMNASDKAQKVQIVAQVKDAEGNVTSETVIQELTMQPGYDGVETGIYDAKDTAVVFAVKTLAEEEKGSDLWLYIGIAAVVVLVAAGAAAVVVIAKKKKQ